MFTVEALGLDEVTQVLHDLHGKAVNVSPLMEAVGELLQASTIQRFHDEVDPSGLPWQPLSEETVKRKDGNRGILKHKLELLKSITYGFDDKSVEVGVSWKREKDEDGRPNTFWRAASHQLGIGNPRRAYLGISDEDEENVISLIQSYFLNEMK